MNVVSFPTVTGFVVLAVNFVPVPFITYPKESSPILISAWLDIFWFCPVTNTPTDWLFPTSIELPEAKVTFGGAELAYCPFE